MSWSTRGYVTAEGYVMTNDKNHRKCSFAFLNWKSVTFFSLQIGYMSPLITFNVDAKVNQEIIKVLITLQKSSPVSYWDQSSCIISLLGSFLLLVSWCVLSSLSYFYQVLNFKPCCSSTLLYFFAVLSQLIWVEHPLGEHFLLLYLIFLTFSTLCAVKLNPNQTAFAKCICNGWHFLFLGKEWLLIYLCPVA